MSQLLLTITDNTKIAAFLAFVTDLAYIDEAVVLPEPDLPAPTSVKDYRVEDIQTIADTFPPDYKWTATDLQKHFPQDLQVSVQILQNQLFIMPSPNIQYQIISDELTFQLGSFVRKNKLGRMLTAPTDTKFDEDNVVQPSIIFIAVRRYYILDEQGIVGAPDLIVEIWSPSNKKKERDMKHDLYEMHGVTEYWQIFPKKKNIAIEVLNEAGKCEVFSEAKKTGTLQSKVLEGFSVNIEGFWND